MGLGPMLPLPWGFALLTIIGVLVMEILGVIIWKVMWHEPDDAVDLDDIEFVFDQEV